MSKQVINVGSSANDGTGDTLRLSQQKANSNFTELYDRGLQEVTDVNNETTNSIKAYSLYIKDLNERVVADETATVVTYEGALRIRNGSFETDAIDNELNGSTTASRLWVLPDFNANLNGCTIADNYTNDITAAAGGIAIGQMYHTAGVVKIRLT